MSKALDLIVDHLRAAKGWMHLRRRGFATNDYRETNQSESSNPLTSFQQHDSAELFRQFTSSLNPMWVFAVRNFAFLAMNDAAVQRYGFSREEFLSMTILDIRPSEDIVRLVRQGLKDQKHDSDNERWRHRTRDGSVFEVEITSRTTTYEGLQAEIVLVREVEPNKQR